MPARKDEKVTQIVEANQLIVCDVTGEYELFRLQARLSCLFLQVNDNTMGNATREHQLVPIAEIPRESGIGFDQTRQILSLITAPAIERKGPPNVQPAEKLFTFGRQDVHPAEHRIGRF